MSEISTKAGVFETGEKDEHGVSYQGYRLISCSNKSLAEYSVKEGTEAICDRAFMNAKDLKSITLPSSVKAIGESAFAGCKALQDINIPEGVTEIRQSTFRDCKSLGCLELPASCVKIEKWAFSDGLETLVCNAPSMQIDKSAFFSCKTLKTVMVPEGSAVTYAQAFVDCRLTPDIEELEMPHELTPNNSSDGNGSLNENDQIIAWSNLRNRVDEDGKYGFVDENGNWVVKPQFDDAFDFSEGLAIVEVEGKWGYIRPDGTWAIEPHFDVACDFSEGLAMVEVDGKWGYIRPDGTWAIEPQFESAEDFSSDGTAEVKLNGQYLYIHLHPDGSWNIEGMEEDEDDEEWDEGEDEAEASEDEKMVTLYFYGEGVRIDVMDKEDDLMDSFMALREDSIYDIDLWVGDDIESISIDNLGETLNALEEDDPEYKDSYDWGYWPNMYKPEEIFDNVGRLVWIMSKTGAFVKIELKDGEKFNPQKFRLLSSEIVTPDGEFEVYCGALYNGKEYPLEIDIDSDDEKGQQDLWTADDDE